MTNQETQQEMQTTQEQATEEKKDAPQQDAGMGGMM